MSRFGKVSFPELKEFRNELRISEKFYLFLRFKPEYTPNLENSAAPAKLNELCDSIRCIRILRSGESLQLLIFGE